MPLPVLLPILGTIATAMRVPMLATFIGGLFSSLLAFFALSFTRKTAMFLAIISMLIAITLVFMAAIQILYTAVYVAAPDGVACGISLILPSNAVFCLSSILSARVFRWVYEWKITMVQQTLNLF